MGSGEGRLEAWHSPHTFLSLRHGDCEDHATLLCSLLLGFGLEAYVVVGTRLDRKGVESDHVWVLTLEGEVREDGMSSGPSVMFWESLTGQRLAPNATSPSGHRYLRVRSTLCDQVRMLPRISVFGFSPSGRMRVQPSRVLCEQAK
jgi:hypothetical protein